MRRLRPQPVQAVDPASVQADHPLAADPAEGGALRALRPLLIVGSVAALVSLLGFAAATAADVPVLTDPTDVLDGHEALAAAGGFALLLADVILPVPSSVVMVVHGALFGVLPGAALSLAGRVGAAVVGAAFGRAGRRWVSARDADDQLADRLVDRWGALAVVASRPVPVLAEGVAVAAGAAGMPWRRLVGASALGALPEALLYALAGAVAATFNNAATVFALIIVATAASWFLWARTPPSPPSETIR